MQTERTIEELLIRMLTDKDLLPATHALTRYLGRVERQDFAFVGRTETFETDLDRFASLAEIQLRDKRLNVSDLIPNKDKLDRESFQKLLVEEYDTLERFLKD